MVDYYEILEVTRTANSNDIKKAYRKLALRWHPDKNPENLDEANKRFKEISEAYEVLIDEKKRRVYDQYGKGGLQMPAGKRRHEDDYDAFASTFVFRNPEDVFREFFSGAGFHDLFTLSSLGVGVGARGRDSNRHSHPSNNSLSSAAFFEPLAAFGLLSNFTSANVFDSHFGGGPSQHHGAGSGVGGAGGAGGGHIKKTSTATRFINGKKITTKKIYENGKETVMAYENDVLKSKTVNGVPQSIKYS